MKSINLLFFVLTLSAAIGAAGCGDSNNLTTRPNPDTTARGGAAGQAGSMVHIPVNAAGMGPAAFGPNPLVVPPGTLVTWTNDDPNTHTVTSDSGLWDSGPLEEGDAFSYTFTSPGVFPYHCSIHGSQSMSGSVQVTSP
ncbi:plastocyanin/azurin family copper-binding protein [Bdellovibrionota bacterium FG-1]